MSLQCILWASFRVQAVEVFVYLTPPMFGCLFCSIQFSHLTTPSRFTAIKKWKLSQEKNARLYCEFVMTFTPNGKLF